MTDLPRPRQSPDVRLSATPNPEAPPPRGERPSDEAYRKVYEGHFSAVWHALRRFGVYERALEDAAHDVFIVLYRRWADLDPERPVRPWLIGVSFRVAADFRKNAANRREVVSDEMETKSRSAPKGEEMVAKREARELVAQGLEALEFDQRAVFVLHELEGYRMPEIAELIDAPLNTLYSRLRLARKRFSQSVRRIQESQKDTGAEGMK